MLINGTLIVQAINFFVVYLLLRILLLKPAVAIVQKERGYIQRLTGLIKEKTGAINHAEAVRKKAWHEAQKHFLKMVPDISLQGILPEPVTMFPIVPPITTAQIDDTINQEAHYLVKRIRNVY
jgi:hypothetical protein